MRHHRGAPKGNPRQAAALRSWAAKNGFADKNSGKLSVPLKLLLGELRRAVAAIEGRGLRPVVQDSTDSGLREALSNAGLK
jgi:hypothetical protein